MFAADLCQPLEEIQATSSISQRLAEASKWNSDQDHTTTDSSTPMEGQEFHGVFSKESFDIPPNSKPWDHVIQLISGEKLLGVKCTHSCNPCVVETLIKVLLSFLFFVTSCHMVIMLTHWTFVPSLGMFLSLHTAATMPSQYVWFWQVSR